MLWWWRNISVIRFDYSFKILLWHMELCFHTIKKFPVKVVSSPVLESCFMLLRLIILSIIIYSFYSFPILKKLCKVPSLLWLSLQFPHLIFICPRSVSYKSMVYLLNFLLSSSLYLTMQLSYFPVIASIFSLPLGVYMKYKRNFLEVIILMNIH
jgi:hypothetical protein